MSNKELGEEKFFGTLLEFIVSNKAHLTGSAAAYVNKWENSLLNMAAKANDGKLDSGHAAEIHRIINGAGSPLPNGLKEIVQAHKDGKTIAHADQLTGGANKLGIGTDPAAVLNWWNAQAKPAPTQTTAPPAIDPGNFLQEAIGDELKGGFEKLFDGFGAALEPIKGALGSAKGMWDGLSPTLKAGGLSLVGALIAVPLLASIPIIGKPLSGIFSKLMPFAAIILGVMFLGNLLSNDKGMGGPSVSDAGNGQGRVPGGDEIVPAGSVAQSRIPDDVSIS